MQVISGGKEVTLPSGVKYTDLKVGGGTPVQKGYLVILNFRCRTACVGHILIASISIQCIACNPKHAGCTYMPHGSGHSDKMSKSY